MKKQIVVTGKTDAIISLNKVGVPVRGKNPTIITIDTPEKEAEINALVRMNLISIADNSVKKDIIQEVIDEAITESIQVLQPTRLKGGRPKGSKNKKFKTESQRVEEAEAKTQQMGSRVVIGTGNGNKEGKMAFSAIDSSGAESEKTQASLDAMTELNSQEKLSKEKKVVDESKLDPSEQQGRKATISTEGKEKAVELVNNIIPESQAIRDADPFIDKTDDPDDSFDDAFIKV